MKKLLLGGLLAAFAFFGSAYAQDFDQSVLVVPSCGTVPFAYTAGQKRMATVDTNGNLCSSGGGGGGSVTQGTVPWVTATTDTRPAASSITIQDTGSTTSSGQNSVNIVAGTPTPSSFYTQAINGQSSVRVNITGAWTGTLAFEISADGGTTWVTVPMRVAGTVFTAGSVTANGLFYGDVSGATNFRVRATAAMTGTATVQTDYSAAPGAVQVLNPVRIVDNSNGASATIKLSGATPLTTDPSFVVALSPNGAPFGLTGSGVPTNAYYNGFNVAGALRGWTGVNPSGSIYAGQVDIASVAGTTAVPVAVSNAGVTASTNVAAVQGATGGVPVTTAPQPQTGSGYAASHGSTTALGTSLVASAAAANLYGFNCTGIAGGAAGYCIAYNGTTVPGTGALTGANVLDFCYYGTTPAGCSLQRNLPVNYTTGIVILISSAATPYTYTTGTNTGAITADYK